MLVVIKRRQREKDRPIGMQNISLLSQYLTEEAIKLFYIPIFYVNFLPRVSF